MKKLLLFVAVIVSHFPLQGFTGWEEFEIIEDYSGAKIVKGTYSYQGNDHENPLVSVHSTQQHELKNYISLLNKQNQPYFPSELGPNLFYRNLERQAEGRLCHLYSLSHNGKHLGFIHIGRKKTQAVWDKKVGWIGYDSKNQSLIESLWTRLGIVRGKGMAEERRKRRGMALVLPILNPDLNLEEQKMAIEVSFQLICKLRKEGFRLLPEKKVIDCAEEETEPYQVVCELFENDPLVCAFQGVGFTSYKNPIKYKTIPNKECFLVRKVKKK